MAFGYRPSRSSRGGGFRSPRGGRGSFRGRGRGSDSYFGSSRGSYSDRPSFRGSSYQGSSFRDRDDYYDSRNSGNKYSHDRYPSSRGRKDEDSYHHRDIRESSGPFSRDHSRRSDGEPERKKLRSEIGSYKEGVSPRRPYDDMEHSGRGFNSNASPYHSDSSSFGKSHKKEYPEFKKPMPPDHDFGSRRAIRGSRGRGSVARSPVTRIKPTAPALLKRPGVSRISRISTAARLQQLLRRKKQLRIMRMRREREERLRVSGTKHEDENNIASSEEELEAEDDLDHEPQVEEEDEDVKPDLKALNESKNDSREKTVKKVIKKEPSGPSEKSSVPTESTEPKEKKYTPVKGLRRDHIALKCIHCKAEYETFKVYHVHLSSYKHKTAMEKLLYSMKQKLSHMRTEQREQQRIIDEQSDDFAKTSYCKLCKLNYKQTKQEHYTSDFHINMSEFLNPRCSVCRVSFATPILYEHHRCTLQHIKRKAFLEKKKEMSLKDAELDDENNDEDSFMVLDSVGSADESNEESEQPDGSGDAADTNASSEPKTKAPKVIGSEFIKQVSCYYCKLCRLCLTYNPNRDQEELLLSHCRGRFHLKRFSLEKMKNKKKPASKVKTEDQTENTNTNETGDGETDEKFWADEEPADDHKSSEDEDSQSGSGNRYDRFGHSDEKETVEKLKAIVEAGGGDADTDDQKNAGDIAKASE